MRKGILCLGCSFTWGEGLYYYSGLEGLTMSEEHNFPKYQSQHRSVYDSYREMVRWPRLVSNHFNTWEWTGVGTTNGGTNIQLYSDIIQKKLNVGDIKYSDFDYFVWQFTDVIRDCPYHDEIMTQFLDDNDFMDILELETRRFLLFADRKIKEWESRGVKVITIVWQQDIVLHPLYDKLFSKRHANIEYQGIEYKSFSELFVSDSKTLNSPAITIRDDFYEKGFQKNDSHPNLLGHQILANSIIKKINNYE